MLTIAQRKTLAAIGRLGGIARRKSLTAKRRQEIARKAGSAQKKKRNGNGA